MLLGHGSDDSIDVLYGSPDECKALLDSGDVDVALIAINDVLRAVDEYDILPQAVVASTSNFPYATLRIKDGVDGIRRVEALQSHRQASEVAEIILREEYGLETSIQFRTSAAANGSSPDAYLTFENPTADEDVDAASSVGSGADTDNKWLDIGQEWFELTGLPLVWGVFAVRAGSSANVTGDLLEAVVSNSLTPESRALWMDAHASMSKREESALENDLRFQFDPEVLAGLEVLTYYLFYYGKVDDISTPRFLESPGSLSPSE